MFPNVHRFRRVALALILVLAALLALPADAAVKVEAVATGLDNPRGMAFAPDGSLFVVEAGIGGFGPPCVPDPGNPRVEVCLGFTGAVTRIRRGGRGPQERFAVGLPSLARADGSEASGPHDVAIVLHPDFDLQGDDFDFREDGEHLDVYVVMGAAVPPEVLPLFPPQAAPLGKLLRFAVDGSWEIVADLGAHEVANNPGGGRTDSNPYGLAATASGVLVVDAAGNDLLTVDPVSGTVTTTAVYPPQRVTVPWFPVPGFPAESVPTSVAVGPDGATWVGELTGFPFPVGQARIWRQEPGGPPTVYAGDFTQVIDVAFDGRGRLYVLEISRSTLALPGSGDGALVRIEADGSRTTLLDSGLFFPGGVVIDADGAAFVTNNSILPGAGEVLKITGIDD